MRKKIVVFAWAPFCAVAALAGCKQILGDVGDASCTECDAGGDDSSSGDGDRSDGGVSPSDASAEADAFQDAQGDAMVDGECGNTVEDGSAPDVADAPDVDTGAEAGCALGATRCDDTGALVEECQADGGWEGHPCAAFCQNGACQVPPSCGGGGVSGCASSAGESCCQSREVPGGTFYRSYDGLTDEGTQYGQSYPATVSAFDLDVFEVAVGRFRNFVAAYDNWDKPAPGSGRNRNDPNDTGWDATWSGNLQKNASLLETELACSLGSGVGTWTNSPGANELLPITCVDWYTAFAFCVWDGGRLPTEAEWNFAAAGGDEQRVYPWSSPANDQTITSMDAVFGVDAPLPVGSTTSGVGKWGQFDLGGNADEWVRDWYVDPYASESCVNCANFTPSSVAVLRGGAYIYNSDEVSASFRDATLPDASNASPFAGIRCARDIPQAVTASDD